MLHDPAAHAPLTDTNWDAPLVRAAIREIVRDAEDAYDERSLWTAHPLDEDDGPLPAATSLYLGAAGVIWAIDDLARHGLAEPRRDWATVAAGLHERYLAAPDFPEIVDGPVPSLWMGESGILALAHRLAPAAGQEGRLLALVRANADNPTRELMWGAPGTMLAAATMHERTGDAVWAQAWQESADRLWAAWDEPLWAQDLYGTTVHYLGPAHGFAGIVAALAHGALLDDDRRAALERRVSTVAQEYAVRDGDLAQWPPSLEERARFASSVRTQWCHGAPGVVASLAAVAPRDDALTAVLLAGGELTWRAGPLAKGPGLCHGTAGNGYAFLGLHARTGDERWLQRARAFAMHAVEQTRHSRRVHGRGRHSLWTGDPGVALYLASCLRASADVPTVDRL